MSVDSALRAAAAARSVRQLFGRRLFGIPGTYLPHVTVPSGGRFGPWHYWWLAHFLDCLIDESERERRCGSGHQARYAGALAHRLLRTICIRNGARFTNHYYDDMAWLLLAVQRLHLLDEHGFASAADRRLTSTAGRVLADAVQAGESDELGGGLYWNDHRDFKNVAATGPAAIYYARAGDRAHAGRLLEWLYNTLFDAQSGLSYDGARRGPDGQWSVAREIYTYNQGVVLGALVELADPTSVLRAGTLVAAIDEHLARRRWPPILVTHGGHDGGLFTGIAARYLALAAACPDMASVARGRAAALVRGTANALWDGRPEHHVQLPGIPPVWVFSPDPALPAAETQPPASPVDLSTQLQAWMILEAAHVLDDGLIAPRRVPLEPVWRSARLCHASAHDERRADGELAAHGCGDP